MNGSGYEAIKANNELAGTRPTKCVVSNLVAVHGTSGAFMSRCNSVSDVRACLQNLASGALSDGGENMMGVEVR